MTALCKKCGRPLKDPKSVAAGMGKICRQKAGSEASFRRKGSLFRAEFKYDIKDQVLWIIDLNGPKSLTNDIEYVIEDIEKVENIDASKLRIMYKDSTGVWDGISYYGNKSFNFFPIRETDFDIALQKLIKNDLKTISEKN